MNSKSLQHNDQLIPYEIRHKPGVTRRVHLRAGPDGALLVIAPRRMSKRAIHKMLQDRSHKVVRFLADAQARQQELPRCDYIHGEEQLYQGEYYPLEIAEFVGRGGSVGLENGRIRIDTVDGSPQVVRKKLIAWYRQQAQQYFCSRIEAISENAAWTNGQAPPMRLRKMKRTWGSCSASGVITLNPRLIKAPPICIDYVIAHELCHLQEMNHGKAFYALQSALYPQWAEARAHLRERAHVYLHE
jgi:predicted metal-dependent hydrolase